MRSSLTSFRRSCFGSLRNRAGYQHGRWVSCQQLMRAQQFHTVFPRCATQETRSATSSSSSSEDTTTRATDDATSKMLSQQLTQMNDLLSKSYTSQLEMQLLMQKALKQQQQQQPEEEEQQQQQKQESSESEGNKKKTSTDGGLIGRWKGLLFSSSTLTAVVAYLIWQQSFQPIANMRKTFSGINHYTTPPGSEVVLDELKERLKDELEKLDSKQILVLCAPDRAGKSTLVEFLLSDSLNYEVCQVKLKGASGGDQLMQRLRISFGLEESALEAAIRKILAIGDFGKKSDVKQKSEFIDIAAEVEHRLDINILNILNRQRVILLDGVSHLVYSLDKNSSNGTAGANSADFFAVKELFNWLTQLESCSVIVVSGDGFIDQVVREAGLTQNVKYITMNDMDYHQSKEVFERLLKLHRKESQLDFDKVFQLVGGRIAHLEKLARDPTEQKIEEVELSMEQWIKNAARGDLGRSVDKTPPLARLYVINRLIEKSEQNENIMNVEQPSEHSTKLAKITSIGIGNGPSSCGPGVELHDFVNAGIPQEYIEKLSRTRIVSYNPVDGRVTLPCRLHYNMFKKNRAMLESECFFTVHVKNLDTNIEQVVRVSTTQLPEFVNTIKKAFKVAEYKNVEVFANDVVMEGNKHLFQLTPQHQVSFRIKR